MAVCVTRAVSDCVLRISDLNHSVPTHVGRMTDKQKGRPASARVLGIAVLLVCVIVAIVVWRSLSGGPGPHLSVRSLREDSSPVVIDADIESRIVTFCSDCHGMPRADNYPRDAWHDKVKRGFEFYAKSGRDDLDPPAMHLVVSYFRSHAPEDLVFSEPEEAQTKLRVQFNVEKLTLERNAPLPPAVAHLRWGRLQPDDHPVLLACDMRYGTVAAVDLRDRPFHARPLVRLNNPCHVEPCDLDGDGAIDLVVADLGSFFPDDHDRGRVVWLRRQEALGSYETVVIASAMGRVADVRPADFDSDGDLDLIVAEFGAEQRGNIILLKNVSESGEEPRFETEKLDPRPGAIHVPTHDLNGDGRTDFVALVSQEYECVEAFINQGDSQFHMQTLWAGPDPMFGASGIELIDLDQDDDLDILLTNGDAFDDNYARPCHGIQWLENLGGLEFSHHRIADLPGVYRALAGDIDLDGDLDVVAVVLLPAHVRPASLAEMQLASIVCLEQMSPGQFVRHTLEAGCPNHATLELTDFDDDGDLDFAVGSHSAMPSERLTHSVAIWWNQGIGNGDPTP